MNNTNKSKTTKTQIQKQAALNAESVVKAKSIKLGIDVHLDRYVVVRILDGGTPQPPQRFEPAEFMLWGGAVARVGTDDPLSANLRALLVQRRLDVGDPGRRRGRTSKGLVTSMTRCNRRHLHLAERHPAAHCQGLQFHHR